MICVGSFHFHVYHQDRLDFCDLLAHLVLLGLHCLDLLHHFLFESLYFAV